MRMRGRVGRREDRGWPEQQCRLRHAASRHDRRWRRLRLRRRRQLHLLRHHQSGHLLHLLLEHLLHLLLHLLHLLMLLLQTALVHLSGCGLRSYRQKEPTLKLLVPCN